MSEVPEGQKCIPISTHSCRRPGFFSVTRAGLMSTPQQEKASAPTDTSPNEVKEVEEAKELNKISNAFFYRRRTIAASFRFFLLMPIDAPPHLTFAYVIL